MKKFTLLFGSLAIAATIQAQVIHVPDDYPSIQQGINAANPGDTVLVADSTYYEQINFLGKKPLMVASYFLIDGDTSHISNTIIDGSQIIDQDSASVVYFLSGEDTTSILCGFTIRGGKGTVDLLPAIVGGGIYIMNAGATILNNIVTDNHLVDPDFPGSQGTNGGGIMIENYINSWSIVENNEIVNNSIRSINLECGAGGIGILGNARVKNNLIKGNTCMQASANPDVYLYAGGFCFWSADYPVNELILMDNIFENNSLTGNANCAGAGAYLKYGKVTSIGNEFTGNNIIDPTIWGGSGMACEDLASGSLISGNIFRDNESSEYAGGLFIFNTYNWLVIENNYFFNNSARIGGGLYSYYSTLMLQNNVFYKNKASLSGGAVFLDGNDPAALHTACLINNSFSENSASTGGAITANFVNPIILNSIFWHDTADFGPEIRGGCYFIEIAYSNIDTSLIFNPNNDIIIGDGIINNEDPFFIDTLLNISMLSPCMDAGTAEATCHDHTWEAPAYDIIGIPRPQSGGIEIGAYEILFEGIHSVSTSQFAVRSFPNPFSDHTTFEYELEEAGSVIITIFNRLGQEVETLANERQGKGRQQVTWNAEKVLAGIYFYRLMVPGHQQSATGKLVVVK